MFSSAQKLDLRFETEKTADQWRLFACSSKDEPEFVWESRDQEELLEISNKYQIWCGLRKEFNQSIILANHTLMDGNKSANLKAVKLLIDKRYGSFRVKAQFNNELIGFLGTSVNLFPNLLLGQQTTSSGKWISKEWQGRGLCAAMYEFLEKILVSHLFLMVKQHFMAFNPNNPRLFGVSVLNALMCQDMMILILNNGLIILI